MATFTTLKKDPEVMTTDPICGMTVDEASAVHAERDGKTYYFCGEGCLQTFVTSAKSSSPRQKTGGCCGCCG